MVKETFPASDRLHANATVIDLHAHPTLKAHLFRRSLHRPVLTPSFLIGALNPLTVQTAFNKLQTGGVDVLLSTAYPLEKRLFDDIKLMNVIPLKYVRYLPFSLAQWLWREVVEPPYFTVTLNMLATMEEEVRQYNQGRKPDEQEVRFAYSGEELNRLLGQENRPIVLIHSVEGGHSLEGEIGLRYLNAGWDELDAQTRVELEQEVLGNLDTLAGRGVAYLVLAHFYPNKLITPTFPYPEHLALSHIPREALDRIWHDTDLTRGLTELGRQVVNRMIKQGMLIDVSHATPTARQEIYALVEASGRTEPIVIATHVGAYAINPSPYNLEDWEIKWIADHGGAIGVIFMTYWLMPHETQFGLNFISRTIEHMFAVGGEDVIAIGTDFDGADPPDDLVDAQQMPVLTQRLLSEYSVTGHRKYSQKQIEKILGGNALRVLLGGWGKPSDSA